MIDKSIFCVRLKEERKKIFKIQAKAAEFCGVKRETWSRYENGLISPGMEVMAALAAAGADVQYILIGVHGQKPELPSVLETVRQQEFIKAAQLLKTGTVADLAPKATESNGKLDSESNLPPVPTEPDRRSGGLKTEITDNKSMYPVREETRDDELQSAEGQASYQPLKPDQLALLDNLAHCPKEVQDAIKRLALVSARADRDEAESGAKK